MPTLKINDIVRSLTRKGFQLLEDGRHKRLIFIYKGKISNIRTHFSHSSSEIDDFLIGKMAEQIKINKANFLRFVECTLSAEDYETLVRPIVEKSSGIDDN